MPPIPRSQMVTYAVIGVAVLVLGGRWLAARASGGERAVALPPPTVTHGGGARGAGGAGAAADGAAADGAAGDVRLDGPSGLAFVHVVGAVRRPGVYRLGAHARIQDAIRRAGGPTRRADVDAINLAAMVQDGAQIVVPGRGAAGAGAVASAAPGAGVAVGSGVAAGGAAPSAPINLNTATEEQLETLDGVGPATAAKILDYRRTNGGFRSVDDLDEVSGIGPKRLAALRDKVTV